MCERARVSHNCRLPRKAQIAALLPALFLEDYIINIAGFEFSTGGTIALPWSVSKNSRFSRSNTAHHVRLGHHVWIGARPEEIRTSILRFVCDSNAVTRGHLIGGPAMKFGA